MTFGVAGAHHQQIGLPVGVEVSRRHALGAADDIGLARREERRRLGRGANPNYRESEDRRDERCGAHGFASAGRERGRPRVLVLAGASDSRDHPRVALDPIHTIRAAKRLHLKDGVFLSLAPPGVFEGHLRAVHGKVAWLGPASTVERGEEVLECWRQLVMPGLSIAEVDPLETALRVVPEGRRPPRAKSWHRSARKTTKRSRSKLSSSARRSGCSRRSSTCAARRSRARAAPPPRSWRWDCVPSSSGTAMPTISPRSRRRSARPIRFVAFGRSRSPAPRSLGIARGAAVDPAAILSTRGGPPDVLALVRALERRERGSVFVALRTPMRSPTPPSARASAHSRAARSSTSSSSTTSPRAPRCQQYRDLPHGGARPLVHRGVGGGHPSRDEAARSDHDQPRRGGEAGGGDCWGIVGGLLGLGDETAGKGGGGGGGGWVGALLRIAVEPIVTIPPCAEAAPTHPPPPFLTGSVPRPQQSACDSPTISATRRAATFTAARDN